jgi:hypothetical protein
VRRPIPPPYAWQAIAAFGGLFTLFSALADPVDLWRIAVRSHQGEPLHAVATLESLPEERITDACLSLGTEADAPAADAPLLQQATLKLNRAGNAVEIRTEAPVSSPALELVLRVQCPGAFLYARHFSVLIPPPGAPITGVAAREGFRLKVAPGESVASLVATVAPGNRRLQKQLAQEVIAANPQIFPGGKARPIPAGTVLWFPDLRGTGKTPAAAPASVPRPAASSPPPKPAAQVPVPASRPKPKRAKPVEPGEPIKLRQALDLGEKPGAQECRMLLPLCGVLEQAGPAPIPAEVEKRASGIESGMQALKLKQDSIDGQLARLEQSLADLRRVIESQPATAVAPPQPPPKPEIRTVVKTEYKSEPLPWYFWAGIAALAIAAAAGGFLYGRRRAYGESLAESDNRLDEMLASAADEMRDLDRPPPGLPRLTPAKPPPAVRDTGISDVNGTGSPRPAEPKKEAPDVSFEDTQVMQAAPDIDLELDSGPKEAPGESVPGVNSDLAFEMDQALDNTRSMFTDVDRFIALGRTQNALSLLQFQVVKDPKDRDSWIKLLAIYRQEKMDAELDKALREFRRNFPHDKATI